MGRYRNVVSDGALKGEHVVIAEAMHGGPLPQGAVVHHINGDSLDNRPENLMVCRDQAHHWEVHRQQRALEACGHADWLRCPYCKTYAPPNELALVRSGRAGYHRACANSRRRQLRNGTT